MTDTETKLHDAEMQLDLAANNPDDDAMVRSCINAMIAMGRSVTLVMQKESGSHPALAQWYADRMAELMKSPAAPLLRFFNERRVHTIHRGVVLPKKDTAEVTGSTVPGVPVGATVVLWRFEGIAEYLPPGDSGGVMRLSLRYLAILRALVREWLQRRSELGIK